MMVFADVGTQITTALVDALGVLLRFIPALIGALLILLIGWIVARIVKAIILRVLQAIRFDQVMAATGIDGLLRRGGIHMDIAGIFASLIYWFVFLVFVLAAANALGVAAVTAIVTSIVLFLPNLLVALIILIIGALVARFAGNLVTSSVESAGVKGAGLIGAVVRYAILAFVGILVLNQIGVGTAIVTTLFGAVIGGLTLALAIAFGLGGRDTAKDIVDSAYTSLSGRRPGSSTLPPVDTDRRPMLPPTR